MGLHSNSRFCSLSSVFFQVNSRYVGNVLQILMVVYFEFSWSFNIDVTRPLVYNGNAGTNFGAAVELINNTDGKWLLVGAPLDTLSYVADYNRTGSVFLCPVQLQRKFTEIGNCSELQLQPTLQKNIVSDNSKLGATLMVMDDTTLVCAPGYRNRLKSNDTSGACVYFNNEDTTSISSLLIRIPFNDPYSFSWSMFGFSATPGINETFPYTIGGPNSGHQAGGLATFTYSSRGRGKPRLTSLNVPGTNTKQPGSYFGYSLESGVFDGNQFYYVAGRPGFANKQGNIGNVEILEFYKNGEKTTKKLISGSQLGGGFGHAVCVADVNGDRIDDVLIGAPLEYVNQSSGSIIVDSGSVYIYLGTGSSDIIKDNAFVIRGMMKPWARFGTTIVDLRDITNDGISDIAIGAPFEDDHRGAVYIYNGFNDDFPKSWPYSQRITSADFNLGIRAFGYSLSKSRVDVDDNLYGDLAVSGFKSDQVAVLRTRPVVHVAVEVLSTPESIPINSTGQDCNDGSDYPCVTLNLRFLVTGRGIENGVYLNYSIYSDVYSESERFLLRSNESKLSNLSKSQESQIVLLKPNIETFINVTMALHTADWRFFQSLEDPVTVHLTFSLADLQVEEEVPPILHSDVITKLYKTLQINLNCSSTPCEPEYVAMLRSADGNMTLQVNQELEVEMKLINVGDPADRTYFYVETFPKMDFSRITQGSNDLQCSVLSLGVMHCAVRPVRFYAHQQYRFVLNYFIDPDAVLARNSDHVKVQITFNSSLDGYVKKEKTFTMMGYFNLQSDVRVIGGSNLPDLILASGSETIIKYSVIYDIHNDGPSPLGANLKIAIPSNKGRSDVVRSLSVKRGNCTGSLELDIRTLDGPSNLMSQPLTSDKSSEKISTDIRCGMPGMDCTYLTCNLGFIKPSELESVEFTIDLDSNALSNVLKELKVHTALYVTSGEVQLYSNKIPASINVTDDGKVALRVSQGSSELETEEILWYTVGGSVGGFLILVIIALILWRCGFFNRKRRQDIDRAKRQSQMKQRQTRMMSQFVSAELSKGHGSSSNGEDRKTQSFRQSVKKDYPDLEIQDR